MILSPTYFIVKILTENRSNYFMNAGNNGMYSCMIICWIDSQSQYKLKSGI